MKSSFLYFSMLLILLSSCNKGELDIPIDDTPSPGEVIAEDGSIAQEHIDSELEIDQSIIGDYSLYTLDHPNPLGCVCKEPENHSVTQLDQKNISFRAEKYFLRSKEDDVYKFIHSNGYYFDSDYLYYYACSDSLVYSYVNLNDGYSIRRIGKKIASEIDCSIEQNEVFQHLYCSQGPENSYCFSTKNLQLDIRGDIDKLYHLSSDLDNQTIDIGIENELTIQLPTDSTNELLLGKYWISEVPTGDKELIYISFYNPYYYYINGDDFTTGNMDVNKIENNYIITFNLQCKGGGKWSGYYKGEIN